jgi:uncharacterized protein YdgA (DUF945 family)
MAWVQSTFPKSTQTTQLTTQSVTFDGKVTAGNCLLVCVTYSTVPGATISSITDSHSNTWTQVELVTDTTATQATAVYSTFGCAGGATTITVHFSGSGATYIGVIAAEYTNASSVDVHNSNQAAPSVTTNGMTTGLQHQHRHQDADRNHAARRLPGSVRRRRKQRHDADHPHRQQR